MSYIINRFNGTQLVVLDDGTIDTSTSVGLVGRNYVGYGETQNENFVFLLENFANTAPPSRPITGQIWFNTTDNTAYAYDSAQWNPIGSATVSVTEPPNTNAGALWLKTPINQLFTYTGTEWRLIGPESVEGFASTKARSATINDINSVARPVIILETNGIPLAICTSAAFTINSSNSIAGFENNLQVGINLSTSAKINGSITGNAATATQLQTARLINGVPFTGDTNITVKSSTTNYLKKGTYILGADFDGSSETTWSVDATPSNSIGKVVARNSQGGFSAEVITADLVGNVTGNVTANSGTSVFNTVQANQFIGAQLTGNAATATRLATAKTINGVNFDGTNNITVTADAATLTGTTLNSGVTLSSLNQVGTLNSLTVADTGVTVGSGSTLRLFVDAATPTIRSNTGLLNFDMGVGGPDIFFINSQASLGLGGPNAPAVIGNNTTNLGINGYPFAGVYATNFFGNATSATTAVTATNIVGGGAGSIPYQTAAGTTAMLGLGTAGYVLKAQAGTIAWDTLSTEQLTKGSYVNMINTATSAAVASYNSNTAVTISVDATSTNTASKVVARDASGNFAAGTINANLVGSVTGSATTAINLISGSGVIQTTTPGTSYSSAIQVREASGGAGNPSGIYAPRLGFHWGGLVASSIVLETSGQISIVNNPGTGYEAFRCAGLTATTGTFSGAISASNATVTAGVGNRIVVADSNGYIFNNYFNSTDNVIGSGVTSVMSKAGDNFYRSANAAAIATFISGQSMNISGNATTATSASYASNAGNASTVSTVTSAQVAIAIANLNAGAVGTYAWMGCAVGGVGFGSNVAGSSLFPAGFWKGSSAGTNGVPSSNNGDAWMNAGYSVSGTWKCMGYARGTSWDQTLWLRIA